MRKMTTTALTCLLIVLPGQVLGDDNKQPKDKPLPQTVLTISPATTKIVAPLDEYGFVDYVQAVNELSSKGTTPESNYETVVRKIMGPKSFVPAMLDEYYQRIGMQPPKGPFLRPYFEVMRQRAGVMDEFEQVLENPWSAEDHPDVDQWLTDEQQRIDELVQGSRRPHHYTPYLAGEEDEEFKDVPKMISVLLPSAQGQREIARTLAIRANQNIHRGNLDAAWSDIMAMYRVSRLCAKGITLVEGLVGMAIDNMAFDAAVRVLKSPSLTAQQRQQFADDLKQIPRLPRMSEKIDVGERWMALDALQTVARTGNFFNAMKMIQALSGIPTKPNGTTLVMQKPKQVAKPDAAQPAQDTALVNWNATAIYVNEWYDRVVAASAEEDFAKRQALFDKIDQELQELGKANTGPLAAVATIFGGQDQRGRKIGSILVGLLLPAVRAVSVAENTASERMDVIRTAYAIEIFRHDNGGYPKQLSELPIYADKIPTDRLSGKPLVYRPAHKGFAVYSVGRNQKDDLGRGHNDHGDRRDVRWDDIVVRIKSD